MKKGGLGPLGVLAILRELRSGVGDPRPLAVAGARELVSILARDLRVGGDESAVVEGRIEGASVLVWIGPADEAQLRTASHAGIPIVAVTDEDSVPYVLATSIVHVPPGHGFPVDEIAKAIARDLGESGTSLAARLPVLREAVCGHLIKAFSNRNALIAAAVWVPGVDMPLLTLNQVRLVLRIALAHGEQLDQRLAIELFGVVGAGFGMRAVARELLDVVPVAGWAVKSSIAYSGTRAVGEAALAYFAARKPGGV